MTGRRPDREPFEAIEVGIRRLRLLGLLLLGVVAAIPGGHRPTRTGLAILVGLAGLALIADRASRLIGREVDGTERLVAVQLGIDVTVTVGALLVFEPGPGDGIWLVVALPVVEGAIRWGKIGGAATWLTVAVPTTGWAIAVWAPGDGLAAMAETAGLLVLALAVGLPAGRAAGRLTEEIQARVRERHELDGQANLLSVLSVAGDELATTSGQDLCRLLVDAAIELGYPGAELGVVDRTTGAHRALAARPAGVVVDGARWPSLAALTTIASGTSLIGPAGDHFAAIGNDGDQLMILVTLADDDGPSRPRDRALEVLCRSGATALATSIQRGQIREAGRRLAHQRSHDPVTGLLNRAGFVDAVASVLGRLTPGAETRLVVVDLNGFASINAANGWIAGDEVLAEVGARLRRTSPDGAAVARLDADRFAVVTDDPDIGYLADHLRDILARPIGTNKGAVVVDAAIGQIITGDPNASPTAALREAELRARAGKIPVHATRPPN